MSEGYEQNGIYHVTEQPPAVEGSRSILHRLWKNGDKVQTMDGRKWVVGDVRWNDLWVGVQSITLFECNDEHPDGIPDPHWPGLFYSRYVGCSPWAVWAMGAEMPVESSLAIAERNVARLKAAFAGLGPWNKQRDDWHRRWQQARRAASAAESELMALREAKQREEKQSFEMLEAFAVALEDPVEL
jgi:hypothetical protein